MYRYSGTIPARTGEPRPSARILPVGEDYPRAYGGTVIVEEVFEISEGLSPRVRGNPMAAQVYDYLRRTIPARTGEPWSGTDRTTTSRDYPRAYGGTDTVSTSAVLPEGLSPRVRGNLDDRRTTDHLQGTIPARTGEPYVCCGCHCSGKDYPRAYGGTPRILGHDVRENECESTCRGLYLQVSPVLSCHAAA